MDHREKEIFDKIKFGIEFETCFHILDHILFNINPFQEPEEKIEIKKAIEVLKNCFIYRSNANNWIVSTGKQQTNIKYDTWQLIHDQSVTCNEKKTCILQGKVYDGNKCKDYVFYPVEIISPILQGSLGLKALLVNFFGIISGDDIIYVTNDTQGLHVNISHPDMSVNFPKLWAYWEPIILQIIPKERRETSYAVPIIKIIQEKFGNIENIDDHKFLELLEDKYISVHYHPGSRYEVRIHEGSMNLYEIVNWTVMIMRIMTLSILFPEIPARTSVENYVNNFFKMLRDTDLINYFREKYVLHKDDSWPEYKYTESKTKLYTLKLSDFPLKVQDNLSMLRRRKCGINYGQERRDIENLFENKNVIFKRQMSFEDFAEYFSKNKITLSSLHKVKKILSISDYSELVNKIIFSDIINNEEIMSYLLSENILNNENLAKYIVKNQDYPLFQEKLKNLDEKYGEKTKFITSVVTTCVDQDKKSLFDKIYENSNIDFRNIILLLKASDVKPYYIDKILGKSSLIKSTHFIILFQKTIFFPENVEQYIKIFYNYFPEIVNCKLIRDLIDIVLNKFNAFLIKKYIPSLINLAQTMNCDLTYDVLEKSISPKKWKILYETLLK